VRTDAHVAAGVVAAPQVAEWETTNVHQVATLLTEAALLRTESRGGHFRSDFPAPDDAWRLRLTAHLDPDGELRMIPTPLD
jgi:L-aspartate oxidase